jgi:hypothetical protein
VPCVHGATACIACGGEKLDGPPCCPYFGIGHIIHKGHYIPSKEEFAYHGFPPEVYEGFVNWAIEQIDKTGRY